MKLKQDEKFAPRERGKFKSVGGKGISLDGKNGQDSLKWSVHWRRGNDSQTPLRCVVMCLHTKRSRSPIHER